MKCPHCGYLSGWEGERLDVVQGKKGAFYSLPVKVERDDSYRLDQKLLYACPSCGIAFIEV
jgi:predicted RNA-binding Zn-ribbon protein involved in translation (DUF1610 family)